MSESDYYEIVRQKLDIGHIKHPKHENFYELMKVFWDKNDIKLLSHFPNAGEVISLNELVEKSGMPKDEVKKILKKVVNKRTVAKIGPKYGLAPLLPGVFEAYYIAQQDTEENLKKAAKLYRFFFTNPTTETTERDYQLFSPILPYEAKEKLIEIDKKVNTESRVLPFELVEEMINKNEHFAVIPCQCRLIAELNDEPCEVAPSEMGCFLTGMSAQGVVALGFGRALTKEEAIEYIKETEKRGLVHNAPNDSSDHSFICNCCGCHCGALMPLKEFQIQNVRPSNFRPKIDREICVLCQTCLRKCPMSAITHEGEKGAPDEKMIINIDICIGCGICAANCAKNSITMEKIDNVIPPKENKIGNTSFDEILGNLIIP